MSESSSLPNVIIAGVNRAGTTSLFEYVGQHPSVGRSKVKETCYFLPLRSGENLEPISNYQAQFDHVVDQQVRIEATPGYFYGERPLVVKLEKTLGDELRVIVIFRNPVQRLLSAFKSMKTGVQIPKEMTLKEYVQTCISEKQSGENEHYRRIEEGRYAKYVDPWINTFGDRIRFLFTEHLHERPRSVLREVFSFVGVSPSYASEVRLTRENQSMDYRSVWVQRLAIAINLAGERFWRAFPGVKRTLRSAYYWINGAPFAEEYNPDTIARLERLYRPHNRTLRRRLNDHGDYEFPDWLSGFDQ